MSPFWTGYVASDMATVGVTQSAWRGFRDSVRWVTNFGVPQPIQFETGSANCGPDVGEFSIGSCIFFTDNTSAFWLMAWPKRTRSP